MRSAICMGALVALFAHIDCIQWGLSFSIRIVRDPYHSLYHIIHTYIWYMISYCAYKAPSPSAANVCFSSTDRSTLCSRMYICIEKSRTSTRRRGFHINGCFIGSMTFEKYSFKFRYKAMRRRDDNDVIDVCACKICWMLRSLYLLHFTYRFDNNRKKQWSYIHFLLF